MPTPPCNPTPGPANAFALAPGETECDLLPRLYALLYAGAAGSTPVEVRERDSWIRWAPPNVGLLRMEIRRLEAVCGKPHSRSRRAGPFANPWGRAVDMYRRPYSIY